MGKSQAETAAGRYRHPKILNFPSVAVPNHPYMIFRGHSLQQPIIEHFFFAHFQKTQPKKLKTQVNFFQNSGQNFQKLRFPATPVVQIARKVCKKQA